MQYTSPIGLALAREVAIGESLHAAAAALGLESETVYDWIRDDDEARALVHLAAASSLYRLLKATGAPTEPLQTRWARRVLRALHEPWPEKARGQLNRCWRMRPTFLESDRLLMGELLEQGYGPVAEAARRHAAELRARS